MVDIGSVESTLRRFPVRNSDIIPICHNNSPGDGNCPGMVKHENCPKLKVGGKAKFPGCEDYIAEQKKLKE